MNSLLAYFKTIKPCKLTAYVVMNGSLLNEDIATKCISTYVSNAFSETNATNLVMLHNAIFYFLSSDIWKMFDIIYTCLCSEAQKIRNTFQHLIDTDLFAPAFYHKTKSHYNSITLWHLFSFVKQYIVCTTSIYSNKNDIGHILNDFAFYSTVIEPHYSYCNATKHIFEILREKTPDDQLSLLFKIYNQFVGFSFSLLDKNLRCFLFNPEIDVITQKLRLSDEMLVDHIAIINDTINSLCSSSDKSTKETHINNLVDMIDMCQKIGNNSLFFATYKIYLQKRLLSNNYNIDLETTLAKFLNFIRDPDKCILAQYSINDFVGNKVINKIYRSIDIKCVSQKYNNIQIDQTRTHFCIGRSYVWDTLKSDPIYDNLTPPLSLSIYTESFQRFYKEYFNSYISFSNRTITYNYPISHVELNLMFNSQMYILKMTFIQACILIYINDNASLTAHTLAKLIGLPLKYINVELNSLLLAGLIKRDITYDNTDPYMTFTFNAQFSDSLQEQNNNIAKFIDEYNDMPNKKFAKDKQDIVQLLNSGPKTSFNELTIDHSDLEKCLQSLLDQGSIKNINGIYTLNLYTSEEEHDDIKEKIDIDCEEFSDISDQEE